MTSGNDFLFHRLQTTAHAVRRATDRRVMSLSDVTSAQAAVLAVVKEKGPVQQRVIAADLRLNESALTSMVSRLLEAGMLARRRSASDGRAWSIELTRGGEKALRQAKAALGPLNDALTEALSGSEYDQLLELLATVEKSLASVDSEESD